MTHDELLTEIDSLNNSCSVVDRVATALRAVVELHKPSDWDNCLACSGKTNETIVSYPCPTIQAIEKGLG